MQYVIHRNDYYGMIIEIVYSNSYTKKINIYLLPKIFEFFN